MSAAGEDEVEYESDPEEAKRSLVMRRRRAASDDEESEGEVERDREGSNRGGRIRSDESDGQGGVADYDEEEEELVEDGEEYEEEEGYDELEEGVNEHDDERIVHSETVGAATTLEEKVAVPAHLEDDGGKPVDGFADDLPLDQGEEQEKKENEPYAVPTAGAFYMHDDRFRDNVGGRHRRTFGGRKLWESKDDRKWGHDKFEEMTMQERRYDERRRTSRGHYRGRGRSRGADRGYVRGSKGENFDNGGNVSSGTTNNNSNRTHVPASVRGRGPRRYGSSFKKTNQAVPSQSKQSAKPLEKTTHHNSGKSVKAISNVESDMAPARKNAFASSLNSASPPFYPSTSSSKDIAFSQNKDAQAGISNQSFRPNSGEKLPMPQSNASLRGQNIANSIGMEKLQIEDSAAAPVGKSVTPLQAGASGSLNSQSPQVIVPGSRPAVRSGQMPYQQTLPQDLVNRLSLPMQVHGSHGSFAANKVQSSVQGTFQKLAQRPSSGSQASPPKAAVSVNSYEAGETESSSELGKSKGALVGKGKGGMQGSGRSSFPYGNTNVMGAGGNMGIGHGDQNFSATPAFLPVMHFGGQHPGGMGVPTVGMAFPGYVAQPQLGVGNSEMTWLPVLASAAGALGATYCSPYIGMEGNYHASPPGQTTSMGSSSKESHIDIPNSELKPSQRPELVSEEHGQRQNKSRRYSEMNFGQ